MCNDFTLHQQAYPAAQLPKLSDLNFACFPPILPYQAGVQDGTRVMRMTTQAMTFVNTA